MSRTNPFTNASITPVHVDKPHIVFAGGYWSVSAYLAPRHPTKQIHYALAHTLAHTFAWRLNNPQLAEWWA